MNADSVADLLVAREVIDFDQREDLIFNVEQSGKDIVELLEEFQILERDQLYHLIAEDIGGQYLDLEGYQPPPQVIAAIPAGTARLHAAMPIQFTEEGLMVAMANPLDPQALEELGFSLGQTIIPAVAPPAQIHELIDRYYGQNAESMTDALTQLQREAAALSGEDLESEANSAPIIRYVDLVLYQAIREQASDIHFEPFEHDFKIRYRVDGGLYEMAPPPQHLKAAITSRIKVMANLNIAESRIPQDGRIMKMIGEQPIDMRVSTLPTAHGESVVLRVLDRSNVNLDLENLNLPPNIYEYINDTILKPNGIFICTGPTGAGKTTTLYACL
ncbi:MAG: Flp pilus assembly complex ATPase component TadA, partial [Verrucomicrobiae bacterium]|nr:Flp pilus assembly complex ATPase component TadA [Verrucomicrobiae bacterium]